MNPWRITCVFRGRRASPTDHGDRLPAAVRAGLTVAAALLVAWPGQTAAANPNMAEAPPVAAAWSMNLYYQAAVRFQNPDLDGCTAAATVSMLDLIALTPQPDQPPPRGNSLPTSSFAWTFDPSWNNQVRVLAFERDHMTMSKLLRGSDPHGWRNGLNYFGWGSMNADVYRDAAYYSYASAAHAVVAALARTNKPVGILGWAGHHAQYITGYSVRGEDPRVSDNYTIVGVYMSDPLREMDMPSIFVTSRDWMNGRFHLAFTPYEEFGSVRKDPIDGKIGDKEWRGRWVVVLPVR
jgi:hypothetical protein